MHLRAPALARPRDLEGRDGDPVTEFHLMDLAIAPDRESQPLGERVYDRHAHAVQAAGDLVAVGIELTACVQLRHHDLGCGTLQLVVALDASRYAAAVVEHGN